MSEEPRAWVPAEPVGWVPQLEPEPEPRATAGPMPQGAQPAQPATYGQPQYGQPQYGQPAPSAQPTPYTQPTQYGQPQYGQPQAYAEPTPYTQPTQYPQTGYQRPQPAPYAQPVQYPQAGYPQAGYPPAAYPQSGYPQTGYPQAGYPPTGYPQPGTFQPYAYAPARRRSSRGALVGAVVAALVVVLVVGSNLVDHLRPSDPLGPNRAGEVVIAAAEDLPAPVATGRLYPSPGFEEASGPLGAPTVLVPDSTSYTFQAVQRGRNEGAPVTWSPCRPIHVMVNLRRAPEGFEDQVLAALGEISVGSGLVFTYDGATDELPDPGRLTYQPTRYGDRWAPVVIQFADSVEIPDLVGDVAGLTITHILQNPSTRTDHIVSAEVYLDVEVLAMPRERGVPAYVSVLRHELGHVVGLDHIDDPSQLMYAWSSGRVVTFQEGDRAGLAEVGKGVCASSL